MINQSDLEHLAVRLHGRRSRLADGERLRALCALASPAALADAMFPGAGLARSPEVQRRLAADYINEAREIASALGGARAGFIEWAAARLQTENLKVLIRALAAGSPPAAARQLLLPLPAWPAACVTPAAAETPAALISALPQGSLRSSLERSYAVYPGRGISFFHEAALDQGYLGELLARLNGLAGADRGYTAPLVGQEIAVFNLMLAARGKFFYEINRTDLSGLFAPGSGINRRRFSAMLAARGVADLRALAAGLAVEAGPPEPDPAALEALAWSRYARLATRAFRGSHMGFGAVAGYLALRRLEAANLTTVSEGLRLGVPAEELRRRLLPRLKGLNNA